MYGDFRNRSKQVFYDLCLHHAEALANSSPNAFQTEEDSWSRGHHIVGIEEKFLLQKSRIQWVRFWD